MSKTSASLHVIMSTHQLNLTTILRSIENTSASDNPVYYGADSTIIQAICPQVNKTMPLLANGSAKNDTTIQNFDDYDNLEARDSVDCSLIKEREGLYETPQAVAAQGFSSEAEKDVNNENYSRLNINDVDYATLEPHIPGRKWNAAECTTEEGRYSTLQHI